MFPLRLSYPSIFPVTVKVSFPVKVIVSVLVIVKVIVLVVISLQKPCQSVRAFRCNPENYENF